jgi:hypothetical protein
MDLEGRSPLSAVCVHTRQDLIIDELVEDLLSI